MSSAPDENSEAHTDQSSTERPASSPSDSSDTPTPTATPISAPHVRARAQQDFDLGEDSASRRQSAASVDSTIAFRDSFSSSLDDPFFQDYERVVLRQPSSNHPASSDRAPPPSSSRGGDDKPTPPIWPPPRRESLSTGASHFRVCLSASMEGGIDCLPTVPCCPSKFHIAPHSTSQCQRGKGSHPRSFSNQH